MTQLAFDDIEPERRCLEPGWEHHDLRPAKAALAGFRARSEATTYTEAHLVARLHLGLLGPDPVACTGCGVTDYDVALEAALDWKSAPIERLRVNYKGSVFSIAPDLDYVPMCRSCHRRMDSWRQALPAGIKAA